MNTKPEGHWSTIPRPCIICGEMFLPKCHNASLCKKESCHRERKRQIADSWHAEQATKKAVIEMPEPLDKLPPERINTEGAINLVAAIVKSAMKKEPGWFKHEDSKPYLDAFEFDTSMFTV